MENADRFSRGCIYKNLFCRREYPTPGPEGTREWSCGYLSR
jgi:hypothetical protein